MRAESYEESNILGERANENGRTWARVPVRVEGTR
jgi:hypothetical protein